MFCPTCGSEERQRSQFCRACGTDLRAIRITLERPDEVTASAISARENIGQAFAQKILETETGRDLQRVAEDVLPQIEKFLESPEERRLRRMRAGLITAFIGIGVAIGGLFASIRDEGFMVIMIPGLVAFFIGLGILLNGLMLSIPRKRLAHDPNDGPSQNAIDSSQNAAALDTSGLSGPSALPLSSTSVTEHTTKHLADKR